MNGFIFGLGFSMLLCVAAIAYLTERYALAIFATFWVGYNFAHLLRLLA